MAKNRDIYFKVQHLPDLDLAKYRDKGIDANYIVRQFENLVFSLMINKNIDWIDFIYYKPKNISEISQISLQLLLRINCAEKASDEIINFINHTFLHEIYFSNKRNNHNISPDEIKQLEKVFENLPHVVCYENERVLVDEIKIIDFFDIEGDFSGPFFKKLWYWDYCDFNPANDFVFVSEIFGKLEECGFIVRVKRRNDEEEIYNQTQELILSLLHNVKMMETLKIEGSGFDNPIKGLFEKASEWISRLFEIWTNSRSAYHEIFVFGETVDEAMNLSQHLLSYLSTNRKFSLKEISSPSWKDIFLKGQFPIHDQLYEFIKNKVFETHPSAAPGFSKIEEPSSNKFQDYLRFKLESLRSIEELLPICRFVIPTKGEVKGFPLESFSYEPTTDGIHIGKLDVSEQDVKIPLLNLAKNTFVTGVPGSGKTTVLLNIISQLYANNVNFLCIEPVKTEFRSIMALNKSTEKDVSESNGFFRLSNEKIHAIPENIQLYSPGNDEFIPFSFNPFIIPAGITVDNHIKSLMTAFESAIPMIGPAPNLIRQTLIELYTNNERFTDKKIIDKLPCFNIYDIIDDPNKYSFPTILHFEKLIKVITSEIYEGVGEFKSQLQAFLDNRISTLTQYTMRKIFDTDKNSFGSVQDLLCSKVILEMDALSENEANLLTMFLITQLRNVIKLQDINPVNLKYILILEEAHNIVGTDLKNYGEGTADPKETASRFIIKMMAEIRAYGMGVIISDQFPTAVHSMIIKNTSTKIAHRVVSKEDKDVLADSMLLNEIQKETLTSASAGESFVFMEKWLKPLKVFEPHLKAIYNIDKDFGEREIIDIVKNSNWHKENQILAKKNEITIKQSLQKSKDKTTIDRNKIIESKKNMELLTNEFPNKDK